MSIRVNTNIASLNAQRNLSNTNQMLNKTLERLSSGLRINRAADDAAGMAVSEKMRTQIRGFSQAIANAQDASNLIATAESGLDQTTQILQRIRELSIQAASDGLVFNDRKKIQVEISELVQELDKIAETTEFNTRALLDGSIQQTAAQEDATFAIKSNARIGQATDTSPADPQLRPTDFLTIDGDTNDGINETTANLSIAQDAAFTFTILQKSGSTDTDDDLIATDGTAFSNTLGGTDPEYFLEIRTSLGKGAVTYIDLGDGTGSTQQIDLGSLFTEDVDGNTIGLTDFDGNTQTLNVTFNLEDVDLSTADVGKSTTVQLTGARQAIAEDKALTFHVGANEGQFLRVGAQDMRARALRLEGLNIVGSDTDPSVRAEAAGATGNRDAESRLLAQNAIGVVDQALDYVNTVRARMGAMQNRIEYRLANMQVSRENLMASESRIRDADIAAETANLTKAQILVQAGTAVLTQANISPQSVLNLL